MSERRGRGMSGSGRGFRSGPAMSRPVEKAKDFRGTLKRLVRYLGSRKFSLIQVFVIAILSTAFNIVSPKILGLAITRLFEGMTMKLNGVPGAGVDFEYIWHILLILGGLYLASSIFSYIQQHIMVGVSQSVIFDLREDVNDKIARLPLTYFDSHAHGDILSRVTNDIDNISTTLQQSLTQIITSVITIIGVFIMMLTISPLITLVTVLTLPLYAVVTKTVVGRSQKYFARQQAELGILNGHIEEMYTGHQIVKAFGHEQHAVKQFDAINERLYEVGWKAQFISGVIMPLMNFISNIGYVFVAVVGAIFVTTQTITIGDVQAFIQYSRQLSQPISQSANIANIIQSTLASAERVFELLDEQEQSPDAEDAKVIGFPRGEVSFEHVCFGYKENEPLIEDMSFTVHPGQTVAIVGPTGAGKTTLVNLLMRFYEIDSGKIVVDGVDTSRMKREDLRSLYGMVLQDTWLFNGSIKENIAYGRAGASDAEIIAAAAAAHADHFIRTLPDGYETMLNEEASNLSQGQKQLLTIARAILVDPTVLILDEATSSVDTRTEILIQEAMHNLMQGRTSFVIAHRLSTIRNADLILVMNEGSIIEKGTHRQLLRQQGFYAALYQSQFAG